MKSKPTNQQEFKHHWLNKETSDPPVHQPKPEKIVEKVQADEIVEEKKTVAVPVLSGPRHQDFKNHWLENESTAPPVYPYEPEIEVKSGDMEGEIVTNEEA